jgi:flagellar basal-body rod modification protein FlgD
MTINPAASTSASAPAAAALSGNQTTPAGLQPQQITMSDFMTLLSAQLKGQDPTNPVDPTAFVTQLAQFTQLDEVSQIYSLLQNYFQSAAAGSAGSPAASPAGSSPAAGTSGSQPGAASSPTG